jgi:hypothetical protein
MARLLLAKCQNSISGRQICEAHTNTFVDNETVGGKSVCLLNLLAIQWFDLAVPQSEYLAELTRSLAVSLL